MNGDFILLLIYILEAAILGAIAFIVRRKHSGFPDFKIGYHVKEAEADRESWEYANDIAGKICALFAMVFLAAGLFCYIMGFSFIYTFELLLLLTVAAVGCTLCVPVYLLKGTDRQRARANRTLRRVRTTVLVMTVLWLIWLYAYYHTPSADNLPGLQSLQMDDLRELKGYKRGQLISVWDDPVRKVSPEQDIWKLDGDQYLLVTYKSNGTVEDAEISGLISGCGDSTGGSPELPTPENLYSNDSEIDMFVYEGTAFVNAEDVDWVTEQDLTAGELAGRIEETDADGDFEDWDATVLPEGTKIYETDDAQIMLAECEGEFVPYLKYVEG